MAVAPAIGDVVLLQPPTADRREVDKPGRVPAMVTKIHDDGAVTLVAFSAEWPLTTSRVFRNVPHFLRTSAPPWWLERDKLP